MVPAFQGETRKGPNDSDECSWRDIGKSSLLFMIIDFVSYFLSTFHDHRFCLFLLACTCRFRFSIRHTRTNITSVWRKWEKVCVLRERVELRIDVRSQWLIRWREWMCARKMWRLTGERVDVCGECDASLERVNVCGECDASHTHLLWMVGEDVEQPWTNRRGS